MNDEISCLVSYMLSHMNLIKKTLYWNYKSTKTTNQNQFTIKFSQKKFNLSMIATKP